ncbi:transposase, partial [Acinetobacter baumannii]
PSQKLTRISRFNDDLRVCPKCATRDYETCPSCQKHRLLESDVSGQRTCKKCRDKPQKSC